MLNVRPIEVFRGVMECARPLRADYLLRYFSDEKGQLFAAVYCLCLLIAPYESKVGLILKRVFALLLSLEYLLVKYCFLINTAVYLIKNSYSF